MDAARVRRARLEDSFDRRSPQQRIARLAARASRAMDGRKVDVLLLAPNLMRQPIHDIAQRQGVLL